MMRIICWKRPERTSTLDQVVDSTILFVPNQAFHSVGGPTTKEQTRQRLMDHGHVHNFELKTLRR
jgi:hypothetical protein